MKRVVLAFFLSSMLIGSAWANQDEQVLVSMEQGSAARVYAAGGSYGQDLLISIAPGFHINSDKPKSPELIPTRLTLSGAQGITLAECIVPPVSQHTMQGEAAPWDVWSGQIVFKPTIKIDPQVKPGKYNLVWQLYYQACDDQLCQMPTTCELIFTIEVTAK